MNGRGVVVVALLLVAVIAPIAYAADYQFGGTYTEKVYPMVQSQDWLAAATAQIPYNPAALEVDIQHAWALDNRSDAASGVGTGSYCWLWPAPSQTYGYLDALMAQVLSSVALYTTSGGVFHNSSFTNWAGVSGAMHLLGNATGDVAGCFFLGGEPQVLGLVAYPASTFGLLLTAALIPERKNPPPRRPENFRGTVTPPEDMP